MQFHVCSEWFAQRFFAMPPLEHGWRVCRNGRRCVYDVWGFLRCLSEDSARRVCPSGLSISAMVEDCSLQVRTGADPPGPRRRPSGDVRAARTCAHAHAKKNVARRAGAKIQIHRETISSVRLVLECFLDPFRGLDSHLVSCPYPKQPASRELSMYIN